MAGVSALSWLIENFGSLTSRRRSLLMTPMQFSRHEDIGYMLLTSVCASVETESFVDGVCLPHRVRPGKNLANIRYGQLDEKHGEIDYFPTQLLNNYGGFQPRLHNIGNS